MSPKVENFDLSDVVLINGSEPVSIDSIERFTDTFLPYGLSKTAVRPSYGMAEATLFVSSIQPDTKPSVVYLDREQMGVGRAVRVAQDDSTALAQVSCGQVSLSQWAAIVDPDTEVELPDGCVGEIWLHGANIGHGYWARPEETQNVFGNHLPARLARGSHADGAPADATWMRTGDLGVYLDGELYITGRIKDMVILDGRNHYPQDIEATAAEASTAVRAGYVAAFAVPARELPRTAPTDTSEEIGDRCRAGPRRRPGGPPAHRRRHPQGNVAPAWNQRVRRSAGRRGGHPTHHQRQAGAARVSCGVPRRDAGHPLDLGRATSPG